MLAELERHPHARAVLAPALGTPSQPSHAYLFHGPGGAGKRAAARALAAELLAEGEANPDSARARVLSGAHPDLTWVVPSGAHEILVSDIDQPVISAASKTPFESSRRVFVIERADELGDEAANRMLKTLEEPASFVHLILLTDRLGEILPTIRSRCQTVRFEAPSEEEAAAGLEEAKRLGRDVLIVDTAGRLSIDEDLMEAAGILPYEAIVCSNLNNGERFMTYAMAGKRGAGEIILNGPTARKGAVRDQIIIFCYEYYAEEEIKRHVPKIIQVNEKNRIVAGKAKR